MSRNYPQPPRSHGSTQRVISVAVIAFVATVLVVGIILIVGAQDNNNDTPAAGVTTGTEEPTPTLSIPTEEPTETPSMPATTPTPPASTPTPESDDAISTPTATPTDQAVTATPVQPTATDPPPPTATPTSVPPTATPEQAPPEPTSELEPVPTETTEPPIGAFGELPPAQLPSGGAASTLNLSYQLGMSLESLPAIASAYRIEWPVYSLEEVQATAERLGLIGQVVEEGVGIYRIESDRGTLYVSPSEIVFRSAGFGTGSGLPDDSTAISTAREWLQVSQFVGSNLGSGTVVGRDPDQQRVVVRFRPSQPSPNLAPTPSATVNIGSGNTVLEAQIHWPASMTPSEYGLRAPINLWQSVQNGLGYLTADLSNVSASGQLSGTATITDFSIAYTAAGSPLDQQYLVPLVMFNGTARIEQTGEEVPISVAVPAVYHEASQFG